MKTRTLALIALAATLCTGALLAQQAKKTRPVNPANAEKVSYAELDKPAGLARHLAAQHRSGGR